MVAVTEAINVLASLCGSDLLCRSKRADIRYLPEKEKQLLVLLSEFCLWTNKHAKGAESTRCQRTSEFFSEITVAGCEGLRLKTQTQQMKEHRYVMMTAHNHSPAHPLTKFKTYANKVKLENKKSIKPAVSLLPSNCECLLASFMTWL